MKNLLTITTLYLLLSMSQAWSLPPCEGDESSWNNCEGITKSGSGTVYKGIFKNGVFIGENVEKGFKYEGKYKDGLQHGIGTFTHISGHKYEGQFKDGKFHGQGTYTYPNSDIYVGEYKDGKMNGQGTFTFANGIIYVGEFKDGNRSMGTETYPDGSKYVGEYRDENYNGQGTYTFADGRKHVGEFKDGAIIKGKEYPAGYDPNAKICGESDHLKLLCIQEAESLYDQNDNYERVAAITSELVNTDGYKVKDGMNAPHSNHDTVNRARIQLGLLYVQGYGVEKSIPKALELWDLVLGDWRNAKRLQIDNAKQFIAQFETKTVAEVNTEASEGLSTYYFMYKYVKRCNELGNMYIDDKNMKSAKKYIKAIEIGILDHFKANDLDTDSVWKKTTKKFNNEVGGLFDIIEDQPNAPYDANMYEGCSLYYSRLSSVYKKITPQQEEEKDF